MEKYKKNKTNEDEKDSNKVIAIEKKILYSRENQQKRSRESQETLSDESQETLSDKSQETLSDESQAKLTSKDHEKLSSESHEGQIIDITGDIPDIDENVQIDDTDICRVVHDHDGRHTHKNVEKDTSENVKKDDYRTSADNESVTSSVESRTDENDDPQHKKKRSNLDYNLTRSEFRDLKKLARKINRKSSEKNPAMIQAVRQENPVLLKIMADLYPKKVNGRDLNGDTALHVAIRDGYFEMAQALLDLQPRPKVDIMNNKDRTPLHEAALVNQEDLAERLLEMGAYKDVADKYLVTPLMMATHLGSLGVVRVLLEHKAETILIDSSFRNALDYGESSEYKPIVKMLLQREEERREEIDQKKSLEDMEKKLQEPKSVQAQFSMSTIDPNKKDSKDSLTKQKSTSIFSLSTSKSKIVRFFSKSRGKKSGTSRLSSASRDTIQSLPSVCTIQNQSMVSLGRKESKDLCADLEAELNESLRKLEEVERKAKLNREKMHSTTSVLSQVAPAEVEVHDYGYKHIWQDVSRETALYQPLETSPTAHSTPISDNPLVTDMADDDVPKSDSTPKKEEGRDWKRVFKSVTSDIRRLGRSRSDHYDVKSSSRQNSEEDISEKRVQSKKWSKGKVASTISMDQTDSQVSMVDTLEVDGDSKLAKQKTKSAESF